MLDDIATDMEARSKMAILKKLGEHHVEVICNLRVEKIMPGEGIAGLDKSLDPKEIEGDTVVLAMGFEPNQSIWDIGEKPHEAYLIGDAKKPRRIIDAIREANHIARFQI
jgi:NADH dehydrogenase FAD-containing subunit